MRWEGGRKSDNVEDRRGQSAGHSAAGAAPLLLRFLPAMIRSKTGRVILVVGVIAIFGGKLVGIDVLGLFLGGGGAAPAQQSQPVASRLTHCYHGWSGWRHGYR